jgi:SAM-dependent methyltransferase
LCMQVNVVKLMGFTLLKKLKAAHRIGLLRSAVIFIEGLWLTILRRVFKFHPWHVEAPASARPYRQTVAELVNGLDPRSVVEVGCGLGFVLRLIDAPYRFGYDLDEGAIRAAKFLHGREISFVCGDLTAVSQPHIDVLILVNWIHEISPEELMRLIEPLLSCTDYLVLDAIDPDESSGYRFKHDFAFLGSRAQRISVARTRNEGRSFQLFKVTR